MARASALASSFSRGAARQVRREPALGQGDRILARLTRLEEAGRGRPSLRGGAHQAPAEGEEPPARHLPRPRQGRRRHRPRRPQGAEGVAHLSRRRRQGQRRRPRALRSCPRRALRRPQGARRRDARQPAGPAQDQPDRRARLRASRRVPARGAGRGRDAGRRQARRPHRPALAPSPDHRPCRRARPRRRGACRARHRRRQQGRLDRARRDRRCRALRAARHASRPGGAAARQLGVLPGPGRADAARAHLQRSVLAEGGGGAPVPRRAHGLRQARQQAGACGAARHDALRRQAVLRGGAGRHRRASEREVPPAPQAGTRAAVGRLCGAGGRPRPARAARSRPARAQGPARPGRPGGARHRAGAARRPSADRGVHDPGQRGGRGGAGGQARSRDLSGARCPFQGEARRPARVPRQPGPAAARRRVTQGRRLQQGAAARQGPARGRSRQRGGAAFAVAGGLRRRQHRPLRPAPCAATRISPRRSGATPTSSCTARSSRRSASVQAA